MLLRLATTTDLPAIADIYNHYVLHCTCTYQTEPDTLADRAAWFAEHPPDKYPAIVAELDESAGAARVIGWGSLSVSPGGLCPDRGAVVSPHDFLGRE
jgi:phosphinothricin acetyltransferase